jgi:hypothetical protein
MQTLDFRPYGLAIVCGFSLGMALVAVLAVIL